jgi:hypothetical protein
LALLVFFVQQTDYHDKNIGHLVLLPFDKQTMPVTPPIECTLGSILLSRLMSTHQWNEYFALSCSAEHPSME